MADRLIREEESFQGMPLCPVPQHWTGTGYEKTEGVDGAMKVVIQGDVNVGGSTAVTVADGDDVAMGARADATVANAGNGSAIALLKGLQTILGNVTALPAANTVNDRLRVLSAMIGEVQATPSANTLLARLKAIGDNTTAIGAANDVAALGDGSLIAIVKQLRTILTDVWDDDGNALNIKGEVSLASDTEVNVIPTPVVGMQGNAWNNDSFSPNTDSTEIDCQHQYRISAFGTSDAATTVSVWVSQDNNTYYDTGIETVLAGAGDFHMSFETAARWIRLRSSAAATMTATIAGK